MMTSKEHLAALRIRLSAYERFDDCLYQFMLTFWDVIVKDPIKENWHMEFLCEELQKWSKTLIERKPKEYDMIINISPSETKSVICSVMFPAWLWTIDPTLRIISGSYNSDLSVALSVQSKDIIQSSKYKAIFGHKIKIREDMDSKGHFKNTLGGERLSTSVGARITGFHGHVKILDDANNPKDTTNTELFDNDAIWYDKVYMSRNVDEHVTLELFVQQRVAFNDMTAHLLSKDKKKFKHIVLPATADFDIKPAHLIKYYKNGLMNEFRKDWKAIASIMDSMSEYDFNAQYGQKPLKIGTGIVSDSDFEILGFESVPPGLFEQPVFVFLDSAWKDNAKADYSGFLVAARHLNDLYLLDYIEEKLEYSALKERVKDIYSNWIGASKESAMVVEDASSGSAIISELRIDTDMNIIEYPKPTSSKKSRFMSCQTIFKSKRVKILDDNSGFSHGKWIKKFMECLRQFPYVPHDEPVDTLIMAVEILIKNYREIEGGNYERKAVVL